MIFNKITNEIVNETIYKGVHKSGLNVMVLKKENYEKYYAVISTKYGSVNSEFKTDKNEKFKKVPDGIAHFLEHKLFEQPDGTNAFDKFSLYGANANAFTSFNNTAYLFSTTDMFNESLDHLLDYVFSPYFTDENVSKEQGIIGQEIRMYDDDPEWRVFFNMLNAMYVNHPVKYDIAGTVESISEIDKDLLYHCYNHFYHPENMILFIAGDVDLDEISKIIDERVEKRENPFTIINKPVEEPDKINQSFISQKLSVSTPIFSCGFKDIDVGYTGVALSKKNIMISVIMGILSSESSELYNELYNSGLINDSFYNDSACYSDYSFVQFGGESKDPKKAADTILSYIEKYKKEGLSKSAFERYKKLVYGKYIKSFNSLESISNAFCGNYFLDIDLFDFLTVYESVTYEDTMDCFNKVFDKDLFVLSVVEPQ